MSRTAARLTTLLRLICAWTLGSAFGCAALPRSDTPQLRHEGESGKGHPKRIGSPVRASRETPTAAGDCFWTADASDPDVDVTVLVDRLSTVEDIPYICDDFCAGGPGCGDRLYWRIVVRGNESIPPLLAHLDDSSLTNAAVPNFGGRYAVGDVSLLLLQESVDGIPVLNLAGVVPRPDCGQCIAADAGAHRGLHGANTGFSQFHSLAQTLYLARRLNRTQPLDHAGCIDQRNAH